MPRIVTALFEDRAAAERALQALMTAGVARDRMAIIGEDKGHEVSSISGFRELSARDDTLAALHDLALPDTDTRLFEEGLRRGCALLSARIDGPDVAEAIQVIETYDPVDLDRCSQEWMQNHPAGGSGSAADAGAPLAAGITGGSGAGTSAVESLPGMRTMTSDASTLGTADLRTSEMSLSDEGRSTTTPTGDRRADERAGAPGVTELGAPDNEPRPGPAATREADVATKMSPDPAQSPGGDARPDLHRREMAGTGRVRSYVRDETASR